MLVATSSSPGSPSSPGSTSSAGSTGSPGSTGSTWKPRRVWALRLLLFSACVVGIFLLRPAPLLAQSLQLNNFVLDNQEGDMAVRFSISVEHVDAIRERLLDGEVLALDCDAELHRRRSYWMDAPLAQGSVENLLRADPERGLFVLQQPGDRLVRARSLEQLLDEGWRSLSIDLGPFSQLERGEEYSVTLKVQLELRDVPAWKRWTLFYSDFEVATGAHYQMNFQY